MTLDLFLRFADASSELGYSEMWVSDVHDYSKGISLIKQPPANVLRLMIERGSVFKLADKNVPLAFSRIGMNQKKIRWITNTEKYGNYEDFGKDYIDGIAQEHGLRAFSKASYFTKNFLHEWNFNSKAETMMIIAEFSGINLWGDVVLAACDMIELAIASRNDNEIASEEYLEVVQLVRESIDDDIPQHVVAKYVNELDSYPGKWSELKAALSSIYAGPEYVPERCLMFSIHGSIDREHSKPKNYHITMSQMADIVRKRITAMQCLDIHIKPYGEVI